MQIYFDPASGRPYVIDGDAAMARRRHVSRRHRGETAPDGSSRGSAGAVRSGTAALAATGLLAGLATGALAVAVTAALLTSTSAGSAGSTVATRQAVSRSASASSASALRAAMSRGEVRVPRGGAPIGTPVRDGMFEFTVTGTATASLSLLVSVRVRNLSESARLVLPGVHGLVDLTGRTYHSTASVSAGPPGTATFTEPVAPGACAAGTVVFEIPAEAVPDRVVLRDGAVSDGAVVRLRR
jgi:hypothetical protein